MKSNMTYQEALKEVSSKKTNEGYLLVHLSYDKDFIIPFKDGINFINSLMNAEKLEKTYSQPPSIKMISMDEITYQPLSKEEYLQYKIAELLQVSVDTVRTMSKEE